LKRNLLLQAADFRQQRQQQANLLKHQRLFAVRARFQMLDPGLQAVKACCTRCSSAGYGAGVINITDGIIQQGENPS
jgi:hypothetical protein